MWYSNSYEMYNSEVRKGQDTNEASGNVFIYTYLRGPLELIRRREMMDKIMRKHV